MKPNEMFFGIFFSIKIKDIETNSIKNNYSLNMLEKSEFYSKISLFITYDSMRRMSEKMGKK